jgi:hypothetical protein
MQQVSDPKEAAMVLLASEPCRNELKADPQASTSCRGNMTQWPIRTNAMTPPQGSAKHQRAWTRQAPSLAPFDILDMHAFDM